MGLKYCIYRLSRRAKCFDIVIVAVILLASLGPAALAQAGNTAVTATQSATPTPEPTPLPVSEIVSQAERVNSRLRVLGEEPAGNAAVRLIDDELTETAGGFGAAEAETTHALAGNPTLDELQAIQNDWQKYSRTFSSWSETLQKNTAVLDKYIDELEQMGKVWRLTLARLQAEEQGGDATVTAAPGASVPPEVLRIVNETIAAIDDTVRQLQERRTVMLSTQTRISELESRGNAVRQEIRRVRERTLNSLFLRESAPIWAPQENVVSASLLFERAVASFSTQARELQSYAANRGSRFALHGIVFLLIAAGLFWAKSRVEPFVVREPKLEKAAQIFALPVATGLILAIVLGGWFYPQAPRLLTSLLGAAALVPVVFLLRRMVVRPLFPILSALVVLYFVDRFRELLTDQPVTARIVFLAEMAGAIVFLIWFLKSKSLSGGVEAAHYRIFTSIRKVIPFALGIFALAFVAGVLGFVGLASLIGNGVLGSAYLAVVIYTAVEIVRGLIIFALRVPPLVGTMIVKNNRPLIREKSVRIIRWIAFIIWLLVTLRLFAVRQSIVILIRDLLSWSVTIGAVEISLGAVVLFFLTVWVAVLISRFLRFVLEEDVYPRVDLGGGVSYAVSTMLHYSILVIGFLIAVSALGVDFTKFALIAGAIGIGIGFGLQNIINNFVSGLILLFERPVKVGDTIQLDTHMGTLQQIGLRASVLRKLDGSDVIVPNSRLISEEVINWTLSDEKRRIEIKVGVAYGTDPALVMGVLQKAAVSRPEVLVDPGPKAIFVGFGESSLDFELRAWTDDPDEWVALRSAMVTDIYARLGEAGVEFPFPQRDIHLRSIDKEAADEIKRRSKS